MRTERLRTDLGGAAALGFALVFFAACTWASYARWANFEYRSFDLAYYVQAIWQLVHGRFEGSVEGVPLMGNHVEPIIFLIAPFFLLLRHPMIFVLVQNAALAAMGPLAYRIGRRIGLERTPALLLALALLVTPATAYVALHEFHPEALTAPCLLLLIYARLRNSLPAYWIAFLAVLACKENMAILLAGFCAVNLVLERKHRIAELRAWYIWPLGLAILWFVLCTKAITPALNAGNIDYLALYDRLGTSSGDILVKAISEPQRILGALWQALSNGNLLWALVVPFLGLPLLKPRWLVMAVPVLLQHLLSWRSSEWQIYFHYAAPLIPLFWIALAQGVAGVARAKYLPSWVRSRTPFLVLSACGAAQIFLGPAGSIVSSITEWPAGTPDRERKLAFIDQISPAGSVVAPLPYLSHLAMREKLYSLHYILKGLKTLSRASYDPPPPTDFVLIDYDDSATFDAGAGYYHPAMKTVDGRVIPSSEQLLHDFLQRSFWSATSSNEMTLLRRQDTASATPVGSSPSSAAQIGAGATLTGAAKSGDLLSGAPVEIRTSWDFAIPRHSFPWMVLKLTPRPQGDPIFVSRGLCAPESASAIATDRWQIIASPRIPRGEYDLEVLFLENSRRAWATQVKQAESTDFLLAPPLALGQLQVTGTGPSSR